MTTAIRAIVMGASSGAVEAIGTILQRLPSPFRIPIVIVIHLPPDRESALVDVFRLKSAIHIGEVEDKQVLEADWAYMAPPDYHVLVESDGRLSLSSDEPVHYSRPSIDVLFETAADSFGPALVGIVLTGANADGANGLRCVGESGGTTIVQSPLEASASMMPESALAMWPDAMVMTLEEIADYLIKLNQRLKT